MKKLLAMLLACMMLLSSFAFAEGLEMSDIPNMTAPGVLPIVLEEVEVTFAFVQNTTVTDFEDNKWTNWLEDNTGINISFFALPSENPGQKLELMIASGETLPDVIDSRKISNANLYNYYLDGIILPLDEMIEKYGYWLPMEIEKYFPDGKWDGIDALTRTFDGAQIKWPSTYLDPSNYYNPGFHIWLREDWLAAVGMATPTNTDELYEALVAFRDQDPNGNGQKDEIPLVGGVSMILNAFLYYQEYNSAILGVKDGVINFPSATDEYRQALTYLNKLVDEGLLSTQAFTADDATLRAMCAPASPAEAVVGGYQAHPTSYLESANLRNQYTPIHILQGPNGYNKSLISPQLQAHAMAITGDCQNPEIVVRLLDYFSEEETMIRSRWGARGEDWEYVENPDEVECTYGYLGYKTIYDAWNNPWASTNNMIWKYDCFTQLPPEMMGGRPKTIKDDPDAQAYSDKAAAALKAVWGNEPDEIVETIIYTEEEEGAIMEIATSLYTYVEECQTAFIMGEMDIEADWDSYIATLESIGLEQYLEVVQTAYTRTQGGALAEYDIKDDGDIADK